MARIKSKIRLCGSRCLEVSAQIDTGADKTIISESVAKEAGLSDTGHSVTLVQVDGTRLVGKTMKGNIIIEETCCKAEQEVIVVPDDILGNKILIGNDFMEKVGMSIDMEKKNHRNVKCDCGPMVDIIRQKLDENEKRTS